MSDEHLPQDCRRCGTRFFYFASVPDRLCWDCWERLDQIRQAKRDVVDAAERWALIQETRLAADDVSDREAFTRLLRAVRKLRKVKSGSKLNDGV